MPSVFEYSSVSDFLRDSWLRRKAESDFTVRAWSSLLGIKHHNALHEMLNGKRKVSQSIIPKLISTLGLNSVEGQYLELLIDISKAKSEEERQSYLARMRALAPASLPVKELESFSHLENPLNFFLGELVLHKDFRRDLAWIQAQIGYYVPIPEISAAIDRMLAAGLFKETEDGGLERAFPHTTTRSDVSDLGIKKYHKSVMDLASRALESQGVLDREFQGTALNLNPKRLKEAKASIRNFLRTFIAEFDQPNSGLEEIHQFNLQLFSIQKKIT